MRAGEDSRTVRFGGLTRVRVASRSQRGELLIETIAGLLILALVVVAGLVGLAVILRVTARHQAVVRTSNESTVAAEFVDRLPYIPCTVSGGVSNPTAQDYQDAMAGATTPYVAPDGLTTLLTVRDVTYLESATAQTAKFVDDCPSTGDAGAQKLEVQVRAQTNTGQITNNVVFIKRDDQCTGLAGAVEGQTC